MLFCEALLTGVRATDFPAKPNDDGTMRAANRRYDLSVTFQNGRSTVVQLWESTALELDPATRRALIEDPIPTSIVRLWCHHGAYASKGGGAVPTLTVESVESVQLPMVHPFTGEAIGEPNGKAAVKA